MALLVFGLSNSPGRSSTHAPVVWLGLHPEALQESTEEFSGAKWSFVTLGGVLVWEAAGPAWKHGEAVREAFGVMVFEGMAEAGPNHGND